MSENKEQYIVSARKYRPQKFDEVIGQEHITTTLKNAIRTGQLAHAYLFCGPRGVGKTTCARILARTLNCENPTEDMEACGECSTCKAFQTNSALNIFELDAASNNSVEGIRRLTEQVRYAPQHGKYKIYIIDEVHMLSSAAFNAFLKTLEEPPSYAIFILATTEKHKILPTILSRCQIFDFKRIRPKEIVKHLQDIISKESYQAEESALHIIAQKSEGCMRDALSIMDRLAGFSNGNLTFEQVTEHLNILDATAYFKLSEMLWTKDLSGVLLFLDELLQKGFEGDLIINGFAEHFRNLLLAGDSKMAKLLDIPDAFKKKFYEHANLISTNYILSALSILNDAELTYKNALNKRLHLELCLIRLSYLNDMSLPGQLNITESHHQPEAKKKITNPLPKNEPDVPKENIEEVSTQTVKEEIKVEKTIDAVEESGIAFEAPESQPDDEIKEQIIPKSLPPKPKLKANYLESLQQEIQGEDVQNQIELNPELTEQYFLEFKKETRETNATHAEQLEMMSARFINAEELHLICNTELNFFYGKALSAQFRTFVFEKTKQSALRIKPLLEKTEQENVEVKDELKSQSEILDDLMEKNPALKDLKQSLNLHINY